MGKIYAALDYIIDINGNNTKAGTSALIIYNPG